MSDSYFIRLWSALLGKNYKLEQHPEKIKHGANWATGYGMKAPYSPGKALSAYGIHAYTHAGAMRCSEDLAALELYLVSGRGDDEVVIWDHPVLDLLRNPSTGIDGYLFRSQLLVDLILTGNCYVLLLGASDSPVSLVRLHPAEVEIITTPEDGLVGYNYRSGGQVTTYAKDAVIHTRQPTYSAGPESLYGVGAIETLSKEIDSDINSQTLVSNASRQARPDILISPSEPGDIWPSETRREISDSYQKMLSKGGVLCLSGSANIQALNLKPRDLEYEKVRVMTRESVSAVLGCPGVVLGLPSANFATAQAQRQQYWSNQKHRAKRIEEGLFNRVARLFDPSLRVLHDYSSVEPIQAVRDSQLKRVQMHIYNGAEVESAYSAEGLQFPENHESGESTDKDYNFVDKLFRPVFVRSDLLRVIDGPSNPREQGIEEIESSILGTIDGSAPNWSRYQDAFLWSDDHRLQSKSGYRFRVARLYDDDDPENAAPLKGDLVVFRDLLADVVDQLNQKSVKLPEEERRLIYNRAVSYFHEIGVDAPPLLDFLLSFDQKKKSLIDEKRNWFRWIERVHKPIENGLFRRVRKYQKDSLIRYLDRLNAYHDETRMISKSAVIDWNSLLDFEIERQELMDSIGPYWVDNWVISGTEELEYIYGIAGRSIPPLVFPSRDIAWSALSRHADEIQKTTGAAVRSIVEQGIVDGLSTDEIGRALSKSGAFSVARGRLIARTETTRLITGSSVRAYQDSLDDGIDLLVEWGTALDDNVRDSHRDLEGVRIAPGEMWDVGGFPASGPGLTGVAAEDCNCRCTTIPIVQR